MWQHHPFWETSGSACIENTGKIPENFNADAENLEDVFVVNANHTNNLSKMDGVIIGNHAVFAAKSGATKSLPGGKIYAGMPAREIHEKNKRDAAYSQVISLKKRLKKLEEKLAR